MDSGKRRKLLIDEMNRLEVGGVSCLGCAGTCCTFEANSMMLTPLEAVELLQHLREVGSLTPEFKTLCEETIKKYRLEPAYTKGRRSYLRKTYTCPLFGHKELGCPLPREIKPYGCLAFNVHHAEIKAGDYCFSDQQLLKLREEAFTEEAAINEELRQKLNIAWEKSPLPNALIELWDTEFPISAYQESR